MAGAGGGSARLAAGFLAAAALAAGAGCGGGGGGPRPGGPASALDRLAATVDPGDPVLAPADGFAGSGACLGCHAGTFAQWEKTPHARGLRTAGRPGPSGRPLACDLDGDGRDDFREGADLAAAPAFAAFGAGAPRLSFDASAGAARPYRLSIAGVGFEVVRVYGGARREDYLVRLGRSLYLAPAEYDAEKGTWVPLEADTWYAGTTPRFASVAAAAAGIDPAQSFERRCAGCHSTGFAVEYDAPSGEWLTGYTELGVGCEDCHGPGRDHVLSGGDPAKILRPRGLDDGTKAGAARADSLCARCHTRGEGGTVAGAPAPVLYPWSGVLGRGFRAGDDAADFVVPTADPADYWGRKDNYLALVPTPGDPSDDSFVAAKSGTMQGIEHASGPHAPKDRGPEGPSARCFDCHAPHGSGAPSAIVERSTVAPEVRTSAEDGSLCLACHAGKPGDPFAALAAADVADFDAGKGGKVRDAVLGHMADVGMTVDPAGFQPRKTGVGRCTTCHMPPTATERRAGGPDAAGLAAGGPGGGTHVMFPLWPSAGAKHGVTGACTGCHGGAGDPVTPILDEWALGDPDGDGRLHGFTPRGEMLGELNASSGNGLRCAQCHTTKGFREIQVKGDPTGLAVDEARLGLIVARAARLEEGITCAACHGKDGTGALAAGNAPLRIPKPGLCGACHNAAGITFQDYTVRGQAVHFPQQEVLDGTAGEEPPGSGPYVDTNHSLFGADRCVRCHFDRGAAASPPTPTVGAAPAHDFQPKSATCRVCHPAAVGVDVPTLGDYDGDGTVEGIQGEVSGLLALLKTAVLAGDPAVTFDATGWTGFKRNGVPGLPGATAARQRAAYNWEVVSKDGSRGAHNAARVVRLLQQSYKELTGANVPGAVIR
jgi:hypothetical protein